MGNTGITRVEKILHTYMYRIFFCNLLFYNLKLGTHNFHIRTVIAYTEMISER